jgi:hypothetical protein
MLKIISIYSIKLKLLPLRFPRYFKYVPTKVVVRELLEVYCAAITSNILPRSIKVKTVENTEGGASVGKCVKSLLR